MLPLVVMIFQRLFVLLLVSLQPLRASCDPEKCAALISLCGGERRPGYVAVISRQEGETAAWAHRLPIPFVVYSYGVSSSSRYNVRLAKGGPASAFVSFIIDHYTCLPRHTLFLRGSSVAEGASPGGPLPGGAVYSPQGSRFHPLDPSLSSALVDLDALDRGFLALGHLPAGAVSIAAAAGDGGGAMHPAAESFSASAAPRTHRAALVSDAEGRVGCECYVMRRLLAGLPGTAGSLHFDAPRVGVQCERPYAWQPGHAFWAAERRVRGRPMAFWEAALEALLADEDFRDEVGGGGSSSSTNFAASCLESVWHFLMGQPLYHFLPAFEAFEDLPLVPFRQRCREANASCAGAAVALLHAPAAHGRFDPAGVGGGGGGDGGPEGKGRRRLCAASHGEMDGEDVGVATWSGYSVEQRDHSCCARCRAVKQCEFWVSALCATALVLGRREGKAVHPWSLCK